MISLILRKDLERYWLLILIYGVGVGLATILRSTLWIREWNNQSVFYLDTNPYWLLAGFAEFVLVAIAVPSVVQEDHLRSPTSFVYGRPIAPRTVVVAKWALLCLVGVGIPLLGEVALLTSVGFTALETLASAFEVGVIRILVMSLLVTLAASLRRPDIYLIVAGLTVAIHFMVGGADVSIYPVVGLVVWSAVTLAIHAGEVWQPVVRSPLWIFGMAVGVLWAMSMYHHRSSSASLTIAPTDLLPIPVTLVQESGGNRELAVDQQLLRDGVVADVSSLAILNSESKRAQVRVLRKARRRPCIRLAAIIGALESAGFIPTDTGWIHSCVSRLNAPAAAYLTGSPDSPVDAVVTGTVSKVSVDYHLPLYGESSLRLPGRIITVVKAMDEKGDVGSLIEHQVAPLLLPSISTPAVERSWAQDEEIARFYFLVHRQTGEVMQLEAFHHPFEGLDPSALTPRHSRSRQVRFYPLEPQRREMPPTEWFGDVELVVLEKSKPERFAKAIPLNVFLHTSAPSSVSSSYVRHEGEKQYPAEIATADRCS